MKMAPPLANRMASIVGDDPEIALMLRVQRDEPGAFAELVRHFQTRVFSRLFRCLSDRHHAEDLTQEVFLRLYRNRKRYQPRARLATWVFHIAQNVARNALRSHRRHAWLRYVAFDRADPVESGYLVRSDAGSSLDRRETADKVRAGLDALIDRHRVALELQHFHDFSYPEVGRTLAMTTKAAKCLLYRARIELRQILADSLSEA